MQLKLKELLKSGTAEKICETISSEIDSESVLWMMRGVSLLEAVVYALVDLRNRKKIDLNVKVIMHSLDWDNLIALNSNEVIDENDLKRLKCYLSQLPGYKGDLQKQSESTLEQHAFRAMQLIRPLTIIEHRFGVELIIDAMSWRS
jgi:hypothetical protein